MQSLYSTKQLSYGQSTTMEPYSYEQPTFRSTKLQPQVYNQPYESTIRYPQQNRMSSYSFSMENKNQPIGICGGNQGKSHLANVSKCSSVSGDSLLKFDQPDCTRQLAELQHKLTQQILILREEKLTLMEQQNSLTQNRYKLQRQLNKLKKKERQSEIPINQMKQEDQIQKLYLEQANKRKQLQMKKETRQEDIEYENLTSEQCEIMQKILNLKQTNNELMIQLHKQQEATNDKLQKKQLKLPTPIQPQSYLQSLHTKKQHLLTTLLSHTRHQNLKTSIQTLLHTNQQLHITINKYIYRQKHRLQLLRDKVKQEQEDKKNMLEELVKMKSQLKSLKLENQEFRRAMIYFRL